MLVEEELSKDVHAVNCNTEYTPIETTYTHALEPLMTKGKINFPEITPVTESLRQFRYLDPIKYCQYHRSPGYDTEDYWTFENRMGKMFKFRQLPLPKAAQKPNNARNPLRNHENIFAVEEQEKEWDLSMFI